MNRDYISWNRLPGYLLLLISLLYFSQFSVADGRTEGAGIMVKWLTSSGYQAVSGVDGFPLNYSLGVSWIISQIGSSSYLKVITILLSLAYLILFLLFFKGKGKELLALPFILALNYFGGWNLSAIGGILLIFQWYFLRRSSIVLSLIFGFLAVNISPFAFPAAMFIHWNSKVSKPYTLLFIPLQFIILPFLGSYYYPSAFYFYGKYPFSILIIGFNILLLMFMTNSDSRTWLQKGFFILIFLEPLILPFAYAAILSQGARQMTPARKYSIALLILSVLIWGGFPVGSGMYFSFRGSDSQPYSEFLKIRTMPHAGRIANLSQFGYLTDYILYPHISVSHAPFIREHNNMDILLKDAYENESGVCSDENTGVIILPAESLYIKGSLFYKLTETNNWLLTYADGSVIVLDRSHGRKVIMFNGPSLLQKAFSDRPLEPWEYEELLEYTQAIFNAYRDDGSYAMHYFSSMGSDSSLYSSL